MHYADLRPRSNNPEIGNPDNNPGTLSPTGSPKHKHQLLLNNVTMMLRYCLLVICLVLASPLTHAGKYSHPHIDRIVAADGPPEGVVFELVFWDDNTWTWAAPMISDLRAQLQNRFPGLDVAIVSHGGEQFQLTRSRIGEQPEAISQLLSLADEGVNLHVCGGHSSWYDIPDSEYIDIVDVSPSGPAQVNDYLALGYRLIVLRKPE